MNERTEPQRKESVVLKKGARIVLKDFIRLSAKHEERGPWANLHGRQRALVRVLFYKEGTGSFEPITKSAFPRREEDSDARLVAEIFKDGTTPLAVFSWRREDGRIVKDPYIKGVVSPGDFEKRIRMIGAPIMEFAPGAGDIYLEVIEGVS